MTGLDRATAALGVVSLASVGLAQARDRYQVLELRTSWSVAVAVGLGLCAILAGVTRRRWAATATGAMFLATAMAQVAMWGSANNWLGGNGSTAALWLGLGLGLLAAGLAERLWPDQTTPTERRSAGQAPSLR